MLIMQSHTAMLTSQVNNSVMILTAGYDGSSFLPILFDPSSEGTTIDAHVDAGGSNTVSQGVGTEFSAVHEVPSSQSFSALRSTLHEDSFAFHFAHIVGSSYPKYAQHHQPHHLQTDPPNLSNSSLPQVVNLHL